MLAAGTSISGIARQFDVKWETANRWSEHPEIVAQVEEIQATMVAEVKRAGKMLIKKSVAVYSLALSASRACPTCDGAYPDMDLRLRAAQAVSDRFGLPRTEITQLAGEVGVSRSDDVLEAEVLGAAALVLEARGETELAARVRTLLGG